MEINPSKCGIMGIEPIIDQDNDQNILITDNGTGNIRPIKYNGENIPIIDKYIYLWIEYIDMMSKYRIDNGKKVLLTLSKTLSNNSVPLRYRIMLIKSILIPTLNYGSKVFGMNEQRIGSLKRILDNGLKCSSEVFGMNEQRIGSLTRILDNGLKCIIKKSNFCRMRIYEEFDIKPLYVSAAAARARGLLKWINSNGLIRDLIESSSEFKSRKSTWTKGAKRWLKMMKIEISQASKKLINQL